jgi:hypothetical protein
MRGYRNKGMGILAHDLAGHIGTDSAGRPATVGSADSSKTAFVLKKQKQAYSNGSKCLSASSHRLWEFF